MCHDAHDYENNERQHDRERDRMDAENIRRQTVDGDIRHEPDDHAAHRSVFIRFLPIQSENDWPNEYRF